MIPFGDYLRRYGMAFEPAAEGEYLRVNKSPQFGEDLKLVVQIELGVICAQWSGIKCVYRLRAA